MREKYPLAWPAGWPRTRIQDRESRNAWKFNEAKSLEVLGLELKRFGVLSWTVTRKDPRDPVGAPDPSVAVYISRPREEDFSWQTALGIDNPAPTLDEINSAFRRLAAQHHPDRVAQGSGGDAEIFYALDTHRKNAIAYVNRLIGNQHDYCIACDKFKEARWNVNAIRMTIHSLRQMERDGTSRLLERALEGFRAALPGGADASAS